MQSFLRENENLCENFRITDQKILNFLEISKKTFTNFALIKYYKSYRGA